MFSPADGQPLLRVYCRAFITWPGRSTRRLWLLCGRCVSQPAAVVQMRELTMSFSNDIVVGLGLSPEQKAEVTRHFGDFTQNLYSLPVMPTSLTILLWGQALRPGPAVQPLPFCWDVLFTLAVSICQQPSMLLLAQPAQVKHRQPHWACRETETPVARPAPVPALHDRGAV